jgi:hypothetical protein
VFLHFFAHKLGNVELRHSAFNIWILIHYIKNAFQFFYFNFFLFIWKRNRWMM